MNFRRVVGLPTSSDTDTFTECIKRPTFYTFQLSKYIFEALEVHMLEIFSVNTSDVV